MSADSLLSSAFKLSDDSVIVGSKDVRTYGLDIVNGDLLYTCGSDGCTNVYNDARVSDDGSTVIVTRTTQVVRSVDIKNGFEKWNFRVGQHQISMPPKEDARGDRENNNKVKNIPICSKESLSDDADVENYLRLIVPEGKIISLSRDDTTNVIWEHKFGGPIA